MIAETNLFPGQSPSFILFPVFLILRRARLLVYFFALFPLGNHCGKNHQAFHAGAEFWGDLLSCHFCWHSSHICFCQILWTSILREMAVSLQKCPLSTGFWEFFSQLCTVCPQKISVMLWKTPLKLFKRSYSTPILQRVYAFTPPIVEKYWSICNQTNLIYDL